MTRNTKRISRARKMLLCATISGATLLQAGSCNLGEFTTSTVTTFSGREVALFLVRSVLLTPIQTFVDSRVNGFFDNLDPNNG
ncbi:MAG: hypothetical protein KDA32_04870 [Phycisphaerales bacterium]|nr:hypothetical protein [Phycisphaerales bacterium]